jgi:hypothetical protein
LGIDLKFGQKWRHKISTGHEKEEGSEESIERTNISELETGVYDELLALESGRYKLPDDDDFSRTKGRKIAWIRKEKWQVSAFDHCLEISTRAIGRNRRAEEGQGEQVAVRFRPKSYHRPKGHAAAASRLAWPDETEADETESFIPSHASRAGTSDHGLAVRMIGVADSCIPRPIVSRKTHTSASAARSSMTCFVSKTQKVELSLVVAAALKPQRPLSFLADASLMLLHH